MTQNHGGIFQVWFQNRRMKDKRQKMTLAWPCGDPILAAYVLQAAAASGRVPTIHESGTDDSIL